MANEAFELVIYAVVGYAILATIILRLNEYWDRNHENDDTHR